MNSCSCCGVNTLEREAKAEKASVKGLGLAAAGKGGSTVGRLLLLAGRKLLAMGILVDSS